MKGRTMITLLLAIALSRLFFPETVAADEALYVTTANVRVRKGPGTHHPIVATIPKDVRVHVVGRERDWLKVESRHGNRPGYIHSRYARPIALAPAKSARSESRVAGLYRTVVDVDLREGPGAQHRIIYKIPAGTRINVVRAEGGWLRVESKRGNRPGYLEKGSVERVGP
ncbi:MAG TPA: SH3 domain-containing protein [candidate division Zixibacteria bacterium]|nr:SH3 domain-containing protein [candidate division Zixibacteria bacterium]